MALKELTQEKNYSNNEIMVITAASFVKDYETIFVGTGMPIIAALFAAKTHAPHISFIAETGPMAPEVIPTPISVSDPKLMYKAVKHGSLRDVLGTLLQRGLVDTTFLGGAQVDKYGNINSTFIGNDYEKPKIRLPGSGGACEGATHAKKILIIIKQTKDRFPEKLNYITSPGFIDKGGRKKAGIRNSNPSLIVITDLSVMEYNPTLLELEVTKIMPGVSQEDIINHTGFEPTFSRELEQLKEPNEEAIDLLRNKLDPERFFI